MILIVGLGNPGKQYSKTRHNVGFMCLDKLKNKFEFPNFKDFHKGEITNTELFKTNVLLLKPKTFMNLSGQSVQQVKRFYKIPIENIIVVQDDIDLEFSKIKVKHNSGHGGHNGIRDIISKIGKQFTRIKIGINRPTQKSDVNKFVLEDFSRNELEKIVKLFDELTKNFEFIINKDFVRLKNNLSKK
tara:strand:+ start:1111 stop:1671 length:561 start_codon:yes stop_codon:yes gene_type:complete